MLRLFLQGVIAIFTLAVWGVFLLVLFFLIAGTFYAFAHARDFSFIVPVIFACVWILLFSPLISSDIQGFRDFFVQWKRRWFPVPDSAADDPNLSSEELFPVHGTHTTEQVPGLVFEVIDFGGARYQQALRLREAVLRAPLGLSFTEEELAAEKDHLHIVGLEGETVCATAVLVPEGKAMKMQRVAVAPELQGRGIGRALMKFCEQVAADHGAEKVYVHARDTAVPFYEKNWYVGDGELFDEDGIPHLKMWKLLV